MSYSQEMRDLAPYIPANKMIVLERAMALVEKYEPDAAARALSEALLNSSPRGESDDLWAEHLLELVNNLEMALARYFRPNISQQAAFRKDMQRFFQTLRYFVKRVDLEASLMTTGMYEGIFNPAGKQVCGTPTRNCVVPLEDGPCNTPYGGADVFYCPRCGAPRNLCKRTPRENGRCVNHGGKKLAGALRDGAEPTGRLKVYGQTLTGRLQEMYVEAVADPDYLSVAPEMAALATRNAQLMSEIGDTDYMIVATGVGQSLAQLDDAITNNSLMLAKKAVADIRDLMTMALDDYRRWDEIQRISSRLGRLAESERKRIIDAQQTITVQEMYMLQQEMLIAIRDAAAYVANFMYKILQTDQKEILTPVKIRDTFLLGIQNQLAGRAGTQLIEGETEEE